jgi:hypothetical protein
MSMYILFLLLPSQLGFERASLDDALYGGNTFDILDYRAGKGGGPLILFMPLIACTIMS